MQANVSVRGRLLIIRDRGPRTEGKNGKIVAIVQLSFRVSRTRPSASFSLAQGNGISEHPMARRGRGDARGAPR